MNLLAIGSFATVWLLLWFVCAILLIATYPAIRRPLLKLDAAYASNVQLFLIAIPMLFSSLCTALLFFPFSEELLVSQHCHDNCSNHFPLLTSTVIAWPGLLAMSGLLIFIVASARKQIRTVRRLSLHLGMLSEENCNNDYHSIRNPIPLVFTVGLLRNTIYLSEGMRNACSAKELDIVFAHERAHVKRRDNLRVLAARLLTVFIPKKIAAVLYDDFQLVIESACDAYAARQYGRLSVAETFLKVQRLVPKQKHLPFGMSSINGAEIQYRINTLINHDDLYKPSKTSTVIGFLFLFLLLFICIDPLHHALEWLLAAI